MDQSQVKTLLKRHKDPITQAEDARKYFSTDGSVFTIMPSAVVYPKDSHDVQQAVSYAAGQSVDGKPFSIIGRGKGTDQGGAALGDGAMVVFPAHMNKLVRL